MAKDIVKKLALYRWRYIVGYTLLALFFVAVLTFAIFFVPGGLSANERASAVTSATLNIHDYKSIFQLNTPYLLMQKLSIETLGLSLLSVKLPSAIIAFLSAIGLILLLRNWYKPATSVITAAIMLLSAQFLLVSQQGDAAIMTIFWSIYLMLFAYLTATNTSKLRYVYAVALSITIALSLYTPLMIYAFVALAIGALLHPHVRFVIKKRGIKTIGLAVGFGALLSIPFLYLIYLHPSNIMTLLIGNNPLTINWGENSMSLLHQLFNFPGLYHGSDILVPIFSLPVFMIAAVGIYSLATERHSVQSYIITAWILLAVPIFLINPAHNEILFVPTALLVATGVSYILWYWYGLFPKNPYARIAGLIPVAVLVGSLVLINSLRYFYTFTYSPTQVATVSHDLSIVNRTVRQSNSPSILVVSQKELDFYTLFASSNHLPLTVTTDKQAVHNFASRGSDVFATRNSDLAKSTVQPLQIIANDRIGSDSDRLYVYKNVAK